MTDKNKDLISRLMKGDMSAFNELCPNAKPDQRSKIETFLKNCQQCNDTSSWWLAWILLLFGWTGVLPNMSEEEINERLKHLGIDATLLNPKQDNNND